MKLFIRKEIKEDEYRVPIIPIHCAKLIEEGYEIYFEKNENRCFKDIDYINAGCILVENIPINSIIIGLKELDIKNDILFQHKNMYFSHCFKNQKNSNIILKKFKENNGVILDYEYIVDENNKRLIAFGYWAGYIGIFLGLIQYNNKKNNYPDIYHLKPFNNCNELVEIIKKLKINPKIAVIGYKGRCGKGVNNFLNKINLDFTGFDKKDIYNLTEFDIIINCIYLNPESNITFVDKENLHKYNNLKVIVDISCDIFAYNNPIKLEYNRTTFDKPIFKYGHIDIIAIDNLPSLLPIESSTEFSETLVKLIQDKNILDKLENIYLEKIKYL